MLDKDLFNISATYYNDLNDDFNLRSQEAFILKLIKQQVNYDRDYLFDDSYGKNNEMVKIYALKNVTNSCHGSYLYEKINEIIESGNAKYFEENYSFYVINQTDECIKCIWNWKEYYLNNYQDALDDNMHEITNIKIRKM